MTSDSWKCHRKIKAFLPCYRYFLADTVLEEVTFGWPRQKADLLFKEQLALNLQNAFNSVMLTSLKFILPFSNS